MLKNACPHLPVMAVVFAFLMSCATQSVGGGLDWGSGGGGCSTESGGQIPSTLLDPPPAQVDEWGHFKTPMRIALSYYSNLVYVTDHNKNYVYVYDKNGKGIEILRGLSAPLGLAVYEPALPEPEPVDCDIDTDRKKDKKKAKKKAKKKDKKKDKKKAFGKDDTGVDKLTKKDDSDGDVCTLPPPATPPQPVIYVANEGNGSVKIFNDVEVSTLGSGVGEFSKPNGIAVTDEQTVYVVDSLTNQVKVYDAAGDLLFTFGSEGCGDGELDFPIDIAINEVLGEVYVTDYKNKRIVVFDLSGNWVSNIVTPLNDGGDPAYDRPSGLGIDAEGNLYVVDHILASVVVISSTGTLLDIIGYSNQQYWTGELASPSDAASDGQLIYVISSRDHSIKIFDGVLP